MTGCEDGMNVLPEKIKQAFWAIQGDEVPEASALPTFSHQVCPV